MDDVLITTKVYQGDRDLVKRLQGPLARDKGVGSISQADTIHAALLLLEAKLTGVK